MRAGEREREARQVGGALRYGPCGPGFIPQERAGTEGLGGGDVARLAFGEVPLATAWRMDGRGPEPVG